MLGLGSLGEPGGAMGMSQTREQAVGNLSNPTGEL